jgi:predicted kinase
LRRGRRLLLLMGAQGAGWTVFAAAACACCGVVFVVARG